jgi:hypothetical protein
MEFKKDWQTVIGLKNFMKKTKEFKIICIEDNTPLFGDYGVISKGSIWLSSTYEYNYNTGMTRLFKNDRLEGFPFAMCYNKYFKTMAEWRDMQIEEILKD